MKKTRKGKNSLQIKTPLLLELVLMHDDKIVLSRSPPSDKSLTLYDAERDDEKKKKTRTNKSNQICIFWPLSRFLKRRIFIFILLKYV